MSDNNLSSGPSSGPKAPPLAPVSRSIVIGLGGTGHQVLLDVRRRVIDKYGSLKNLPIVHFFEIDTDEDVLREQSVRDDDPPEVNLRTADKLHANIGDVQNLEDNLQQYPYLASWLDRNSLLRGKDVQHGAGAIRARGRLALFRNYDKIQERLESAYKQIADPKLDEQCQRLGLKVSQSITVYIVGSLLGGTCSGMFLDMAYIANRQIPGNPDIIGIFSIPPVAGGRQDHRANAYAALRELNHYCYPHTEFVAQYSPTQRENRDRREPFTYCYLAGMNNGRKQLSSVQDQISLVGHNIFLDLTSEFQAQKRSNRDNFQQFLVHSDLIGCPQSYMSFGLSTIHFPKDKVISACAFRLAADTVKGWLSSEATYGDEALHRYVTDRLAEMQLLPGAVNQWLRQSQTGTSLDSEIDAWSEGLNEELVRTRPPATALAPTISQHDAAMQQQNFRDVDPNADVLRKNPEDLGLYVRQVLRNLQSRGIQQAPRDLEGWVVRMVDDPHYRQTTARAALLHARELFVQAANGLSATVQQNLAPVERPREEAKEAALQKLGADSTSFILKMVPGAYPETINKDRDAAMHACASYYRSRLDTMVARHAARFFLEMPSIIDRLVADLDAYMLKLDGIRNEFRVKEQETISSPVFINGERLWDRDKDVDYFYQLYATQEKKDNVSVNAARSLVETGQLYHLRKLLDNDLKRVILDHASKVFNALGDEVDVLTRFFMKYPEPAKRKEAIRHVYDLSTPFVDLSGAFLQSRDDFVAMPGKRQTVIGVHNGSQPGTQQEQEFRTLLDEAETLPSERFAMLNNRYEVLFLRESAAFPLRLLEELETYKQDYEFFTSQGATQNPLHIRKDVARWEPIDVPSSVNQDKAWETFAVGWASGVIQDAVDRSGKTTFTTSFRDSFGMPVDRTVGQLLRVSDQRTTDEPPPNSDSPVNPLPPMEVHEIILNLYQDKTLMDGIWRSIESRIVHLGGEEFASILVTHAEEQKNRGLSFYEAFRDRLRRFMVERGLQPPSMAEGQPARVEVTPADSTVRRDGSLMLTAHVYDSYNRELTGAPLTWSARPSQLGSVDARGRFRALAEGEVTITVSTGAISGAAHILVSSTAPEITTTTEPPVEMPALSPGTDGNKGQAVLPERTAAVTAPLPAPAAGEMQCVCGSVIEPGFTLCPECGKPLFCRQGHQVKPTWKRCPFCGDDLSPRVTAQPAPLTCPHCKTQLEPGFKICPECGEEVGSVSDP